MTAPVAHENPAVDSDAIVRIEGLGKITDDPLLSGSFADLHAADADDLAASTHVFHMAGKHDQSTHGRGGATSGELSAGVALNAGKGLDMNDPEHVGIAAGIHTWSTHTTGSGAGSAGRQQFEGEIADAIHNPGANTSGAQFTRTVAGAPANAPTLHRGMADVPDHQIPRDGDVFDIGPTSFSSDRSVAESFARPAHSTYGAGTMVTMKVEKGSHALRIDKAVPKQYRDEKEHVALGRYKVTRRTETTKTIRTGDGKTRSVRHVELEVTQVDDTIGLTRQAYSAPTVDTHDLYGN